MISKAKYRRYLLLLIGAWIAVAPSIFGQHKEQFAQAQKDNSTALKQYTWKSRTELKLKGESTNVKLEQVRYDIDGKLQKTDIGAPAPLSSTPSDRLLREGQPSRWPPLGQSELRLLTIRPSIPEPRNHSRTFLASSSDTPWYTGTTVPPQC